MKLFKQDVKRTPQLFLGFLFLAVGIMLMKRSDLGMASWGVFHQGLSVTTGISFGVITQLIGFVILVISVIFLKTKIGIGTVANVIFVGWFINISDRVFLYNPETIYMRYVVLLCGILLMTIGRSIYIGSQLGEGPRDGLFVGISRVTGWQVRYVKPSIEFAVLLAGYLLGGIVGYGTAIAIIFSGYMVQFFLGLLHFDPAANKQHRIIDYFAKTNNQEYKN